MAPYAKPLFFDPQIDSNYHYVPTSWVALVFISLFGISTLTHLIEAIYFRMWFLIPTAVLAGLGEVIGWSGRYWSSLNYGILSTPFLMQISSTIIAPTPLLGAYFIMVGRAIDICGLQYSRLSRRAYTAIFLTADIVALVVQAIGGGIASGSNSNLGGNIMLGGIIFQFICMNIFVVVTTEFIIRFVRNRPFKKYNNVSPVDSDTALAREKSPMRGLSKHMRMLLGGMAFGLTCLYIRAVYRTIELSDGWNGKIISTQRYFNILDGAMVLLAISTLNILHPGYLLHA